MTLGRFDELYVPFVDFPETSATWDLSACLFAYDSSQKVIPMQLCFVYNVSGSTTPRASW